MADFDLDALLEEHGSWDDALGALQKVVDSDEDRRADALRARARIQREHGGDAAAAAESLEAAAEIAGDDAALLRELADVYGELEDFESQTAVLLDCANAADDAAEKGAVLREAVEIFAEKLEQAEAAELVLQKALSEDAANPDGWALAVAVGERFDRQTQAAELLTVHANALTASHGDESALPLLLVIAEAYRTTGSLDLADAFLSRALIIDESDRRVLDAMAVVQREAGDWESLVETLTRLATRADDPEIELRIRRELGSIRFDHLGDVDGAISEYERAKEVGGGADEVAALHALYEASGRTAELAALLRVRLDELEGADRADLLMQLAALARGPLDDPERAISDYRDVLAVDETRNDAREGLAELLEAREDWSDLESLLTDWVEHDADAAIGVLLRRADIEENRLGDAAAATRTYEQVRDLDDTTPGLLTTLVRLYTAAERRSDAIAMHMRLAELAPDTNAWGDELMNAAHLHHALGALEEAAAIFTQVAEHVPDHAEALVALEELQTEAGDVEGAIESLAKRVEKAEGTDRVELRLRKANLEAPIDPGAAATTLYALLEDDADHADGRKLLGEVLEAAADWTRLVEWIKRETEREFDPIARAALLARAGSIQELDLGDVEAAHASYLKAIELDPKNDVAATPLAQAYLEQEDWVRARPLLEALSEGAEKGSDIWLTYTLNLGATYEFLELGAEATAAYERTLEFAPDRLPTLSSLGRLYAAADNAERAHECYTKLLEDADDLSEGDQLELYFRGGEAAAMAGKTDDALARFRAALAIDELHEPSLKAIAELEAEEADPQARLEAKEKLLSLTEDDALRFKLLIEIGDAYRELDESAGALEAFSMALELEENSKVVLHRLLTIYTETELWEPASSVLMRLAKLEESEPKRVKILFTIGAIYRDQLQDPVAASNVFDNLLDEDPTRDEAFDALESLHTERADWKSLERAYRRHLGRVLDHQGGEDLRFIITKKLGALYRDTLDRPDDAIASFNVAAGLRPDDIETLEAVAAIYPKGGKSDAMIIAQHRALVRAAPEREDSHHLLFGAFERERRFDEAWTAASILAVLGNREKKPTEFYTALRPSAVPLARRGLTRAEWRMVQHPDLSVEATRLLAVIAGTLRRVYSHQLKDWGVHRKRHAIDVAQPSPVVNLFHYSAQVLGVAMPALYTWDAGTGFQNANAEPRAVLLGPNVVTGSADRSIVFRIARTMCLMRNEFYLAAALSKASLVPLVQASISLFTGGVPEAWKSETVDGWMRAIREEPDELLQTLGEAVAAYVQTGEPLNLDAWPRAVELTAHRAALLICGDLPRAARGANDVARPIGEVDVRERIVDMVCFAASEDYAHLRGELGIGIGQQ